MDSRLEAGHPGADWKCTDQRIDLWPILLTHDPAALHACEALLSCEELKRAAAFHFEYLRDRYALAHGIMRFVLGRYANLAPGDLRFLTGIRGKPSLMPADGLEFNLSHCDDIALLGVTKSGEIGVDIEKIRRVEDLEDLAHRFFCPAESEELQSVCLEQRRAAFFCCWTRKEAYLKAIGNGLHTPLDSFRVTVRPGEPARMIEIDGSTEEAQLWSLYTIDTIPACVAAVAHQGAPRVLRLMPMLTPTDLLATLR